MYKVYQTIKGTVATLDNPLIHSWIDVTSPTEDDIEELKVIADIDEDIIRSIRDLDEVPKVEKYDDYQFILIQTPKVTQEDEDEDEIYHKYSVSPLGIIFNSDYLITISDGKNDVISYLKLKLKNYEKNKIVDTNDIPQFILKLLLFTSKMYLKYLKAINHKLREAQKNLEDLPQNSEIMHLLDLQKSLVYFNTSLQSNQIVIEKLTKRKYFTNSEEDEELVEDILDENKQALSTVKVYGQIISNASATFASIISNNLNQTLRFLTSVTIILMIPTLVASVYGMNVDLPFQHVPHAFAIVVTISVVISLVGILWFYRKKFF